MLWTLLLGCSQGAPPADTAVAEVLLFGGHATVRRDDRAEPVRVGLLLHPEDLLLTGEDGMLALLLPNDHVVRVDADLELRVGDLAMLGAAKATTNPVTQLESLLYPDEKGLIPASLANERVAGWHARVTTARSVSAESVQDDAEVDEESRASTPTREESEAVDAAPMSERKEATPAPIAAGGGGGASGTAAPAQAGSPKRRQSPRSSVAGRGLQPAPRSPSASSPGRGAPPAAPSPPPPPPSAGARAAEPLLLEPTTATARAVDLTALLQSPRAQTCLAAWAEPLGLPDGASLSLRFDVDADGMITRVRSTNGLHPPPCLRELLIGQAPAGADQLHTVPLSP